MLPGTLRFRFLVPAFLLGVVALRPLHAQEIWFSPGDDLNVKGVVKHPDFMQLFGPGAPWPVGMAHVNVMQLRAPWFLRMSPSVVAQALAFLKAHRMKLAVPLGFIDSDTSGQGIEGCGTARGHRVYPREMKQLGIPLDYVVMDEPLYFGHDYDGKNACHFSIAQVADSVANNVRMIRSYYPHVQFVWAEPQQALPGGVAEMNRFLDDYQARLSELPIAMRFDIDWGKVDKKHREWHQDVPLFVRALKTRGIGLSIIYDAGHVNGQPIPKTDAGWIASAKADVADWEATIPDKPAEVVIQTWNPNPVRIVPEDDPTTMTGYLKWFVSRKSSR
jgi:hypothetical protein